MRGNRVLVVGGDGMVGRHLVRRLGSAGAGVLSSTRRAGGPAPSRPLVDLAVGTWPPLASLDVGAVVICAAVARLADCARDPEGSALVNVEGPARLAAEASGLGIPTLYLSTDKVFNGTVPHRPATDAPCPQSVYGAQKAAAEAAILAQPHAAVLRLSKVVRPDEPLLAGWAASLRRGEAITPFTDLHLAPVPVEMVCAAIQGIVERGGTGIWQISGPRDITYADAALHLARRMGVEEGLVRPVAGQAAAAIGGGVPSPHTTLDSTRVATELGITVPGPFEVLDGMIRQGGHAAQDSGHGG